VVDRVEHIVPDIPGPMRARLRWHVRGPLYIPGVGGLIGAWGQESRKGAKVWPRRLSWDLA
jgi:hypothetical protein